MEAGEKEAALLETVATEGRRHLSRQRICSPTTDNSGRHRFQFMKYASQPSGCLLLNVGLESSSCVQGILRGRRIQRRVLQINTTVVKK